MLIYFGSHLISFGLGHIVFVLRVLKYYLEKQIETYWRVLFATTSSSSCSVFNWAWTWREKKSSRSHRRQRFWIQRAIQFCNFITQCGVCRNAGHVTILALHLLLKFLLSEQVVKVSLFLNNTLKLF